jgi:hypothetical protein
MFLMCADQLRGQVGRGWALEIETLLGPEMATSETSAIWAQKVDSVSANKNKNSNIILIRYKNRFFFSAPNSPIQMGSLSVKNKTRSRISYTWSPFKILQLNLLFAIYFYVCMGTSVGMVPSMY